MTKLYITCYRNMSVDDFGRTIAAPATPPLSEMYLEISHEHVVSDPFPQYTAFIQVKADADCAVAFGPEPEADPNYHLVEAGERLFYGTQPGHKIACVEVIK